MSEWKNLPQAAGPVLREKPDTVGKGTLFRNRDKVEGSNQPDHTGKLTFQGKDFRLAAWVRPTKDGGRYFSISVSDPNLRQAQRNEMEPRDDIDDDVPY